MINYDDYGVTISQFLASYNKYKSVFTSFKQFIRSNFDGNDKFGISVKDETEKTITLDFVDSRFVIEFTLLRMSSNGYIGRLVFHELMDEKVQNIIDIAYFDGLGNVKASPSAKFSDININKPDLSVCLLKYWFAKFIENNVENENS